jgi:hypothetical protein
MRLFWGDILGGSDAPTAGFMYFYRGATFRRDEHQTALHRVSLPAVADLAVGAIWWLAALQRYRFILPVVIITLVTDLKKTLLVGVLLGLVRWYLSRRATAPDHRS